MSNVGKLGAATASLFAAMLVSGCVWKSDYDELQAQYQRQGQELAQQGEQLAAARAQVGRLQGAIAYTVDSDLLFTPGSWRISPRGQKVMADMASKLAAQQQSKLLIAGYTDNAPVGPALQRQGITSNQELSQKRAESVMQFLIANGVKPDMVAAQGFGDTKPIASNDTPQNRAKNRRVEISVAS